CHSISRCFRRRGTRSKSPDLLIATRPRSQKADRPRIATRVGSAQARIAAMLLLTLRGTPTIYYGDEIGLAQVPIPTAGYHMMPSSHQQTVRPFGPPVSSLLASG